MGPILAGQPILNGMKKRRHLNPWIQWTGQPLGETRPLASGQSLLLSVFMTQLLAVVQSYN
jgi:hypothetical protein